MSKSFVEEMFSLDGEVAVVIGGTGVLGGALALGIAQAGATVVVAGRGAERGQACVKQIEEQRGKALYLPVDVSQRESLEALLQETLSRFGKVDCLVNGAGVNSASAYLDVQDKDWDWVMETNLKAVHLGCQIFSAHMVKAGTGGAIVNIASVTADKPLSKVFAYSASKAAVVNLTRNVARELAVHGIRVNALCPGFFPAEQNRKILDADRTANVMRQTPMQRFGEPAELVGPTLCMLSRKAGSFLTGAAIYVDGGFTAMRF